MKNIVVTGAGGFVGKALVAELLKRGSVGGDGAPVRRVTLVDLAFDDKPIDPRCRLVTGSVADKAVLAEALLDDADCVFHLASVPGGAAERDFDLGLEVNLKATMSMLELMRHQGRPSRLVYSSTIAVYGAPMPTLVDDFTVMRPRLSYGAHKLASELLIQDYSRRGWVDGRIVRLPGIVARPPDSSGLLSAFMSDIFWKLAAGETFTCPVSKLAVAWWMSVGKCAENLLHAARLAPEQAATRRDYTLPALRLSIGELVDGLAAIFGDDRRALVRYAPDPALEAAFGAFPPLDASGAEAAGFHHDGDVHGLINSVMKL